MITIKQSTDPSHPTGDPQCSDRMVQPTSLIRPKRETGRRSLDILVGSCSCLKESLEAWEDSHSAKRGVLFPVDHLFASSQETTNIRSTANGLLIDNSKYIIDQQPTQLPSGNQRARAHFVLNMVNRFPRITESHFLSSSSSSTCVPK